MDVSKTNFLLKKCSMWKNKYFSVYTCRNIAPFQLIRPSVKDEFCSQPKRARSGTESGNQSTEQELNIKVIWYTVSINSDFFFFFCFVSQLHCKSNYGAETTLKETSNAYSEQFLFKT